MKKIQVLKDSKAILDVLNSTKSKASSDMICFYNSTINSILTDPIFMNISIEDKIVHRGYALSDTTKIFKNKIYNVDSHIERIIKGITSIKLKPKFTNNELKDIILYTASVARNIEKESDIDLKLFYSAGLGGFSVQEDENLHTFYVLAIKADNSKRPNNGIQKEYTIKKSDIYNDEEESDKYNFENYKNNKNEIDTKNCVIVKDENSTNEASKVKTDKFEKYSNFSHVKTTNYLVNCITNKLVKKKGGYLGIMCDENMNLLESPISNIVFVTKDDILIIPSFNKTLKGTTISKCMTFVNNELIPKNIIKEIKRKDVNIIDLFEGKIKEVMFVGGDFIAPILSINNYELSKEPGEISKLFQNFLAEDKAKDETLEVFKYEI